MDSETRAQLHAIWRTICRYVEDSAEYLDKDELDKEDIAADIFFEAAQMKALGTMSWDPQREPLNATETEYFDRKVESRRSLRGLRQI